VLDLICRVIFLVTDCIVNLTHLKYILNFILQEVGGHVDNNFELRIC